MLYNLVKRMQSFLLTNIFFVLYNLNMRKAEVLILNKYKGGSKRKMVQSDEFWDELPQSISRLMTMIILDISESTLIRMGRDGKLSPLPKAMKTANVFYDREEVRNFTKKIYEDTSN